MRWLMWLFAFPLLLAMLIGCISVEGLSKEPAPLTPQSSASLISTPVPTTTLTVRPTNTLAPDRTPTARSTNTPVPIITLIPVATCPVTIANGSVPPEGSDWDKTPLSHGNGTLWVVLWPGGKILIRPQQIDQDGYLVMKIPWYRGVAGKLIIEGRRLDAPAPPLLAVIPEGYRAAGFQPSGIGFAIEGCWEVTGRVGDASLTFVTMVSKLPFEPLWGKWFPEGLTWKDLDVSALPKSFSYIWASSTGGKLIIQTTQGAQETPTPYPKTARHQVTVNGQPGVCVQGGWDAQQQWRSETDAGALEWSADGLSYRISYTGLQLSCDDLLRMAQGRP